MSIPTPETRASLLLRVRDPADHAAWCEFVEIYRPLILRIALRKGMQLADAEDVAQQVLLQLSKVVQQHEHDRGRAKFRTWLHRVAHHAILNALTRGKPDRGSGESSLLNALHQLAAPTGPDADLLQLEQQREVFRWAARHVRDEFQPESWTAFWKTAVEGHPIELVARQLNKTCGAIYAIRSRVMRRIQEKIREYQDD